jgi:hypothetical protein
MGYSQSSLSGLKCDRFIYLRAGDAGARLCGKAHTWKCQAKRDRKSGLGPSPSKRLNDHLCGGRHQAAHRESGETESRCRVIGSAKVGKEPGNLA